MLLPSQVQQQHAAVNLIFTSRPRTTQTRASVHGTTAWMAETPPTIKPKRSSLIERSSTMEETPSVALIEQQPSVEQQSDMIPKPS